VAGYIGVPIETDPDVLTNEAIDSLIAARPGFNPKDAHLEVHVLEVAARMNAETRNVARLVPDDIFRYFGESLVNVLPVEAKAATALTTWTMIDAAGYTIPAGTQVAYRVAGDRLVPFATTAERVVAPGSTQAIEVPIAALEPGTQANGLGPAGLELIDSLAYVSGVAATAATGGGVDAETDPAYLSRLRDEMRLLTPRFVLAEDAAVLSRRISGVHRALGIDNYDPVAATFNNEKMITVAVVAANGQPVTAATRQAVGDYLRSIRETNFIVHVIDPVYTVVGVDFVVVAHPGYDLGDLADRSRIAVRGYLSPATWAGGGDNPPTWRTTDNVVRYLEVAEVLNRVDGVHYVRSLTLNGASADVALGGVAPLPSVGAVTGGAVSA
jgi:hypothetical protein